MNRRSVPPNPPSEAQLRLMCQMISVQPIRLEEVRRALQSKKNAHSFINQHKDAFDQILLDREDKQRAPMPFTEERAIEEVKQGSCPDYKATIRGRVLGEFFGIQPTAMHEDMDNAYAGLYRRIIRVILECDDVQIENKMCAACQLELSVELGTEDCPRCGCKLSEGE